jgi:hypothetical protein
MLEALLTPEDAALLLEMTIHELYALSRFQPVLGQKL